ncbi:UBA/TS-N domain containing protein [Trichomonas vaginalis G3]|uniref:UBA/TS-N domain containing protein n=1 Tax=Trichomonas vaginalis (strain ATCC PRA-98 / G3) TaxID=412133 RepID=A2FMC5_TRIV3|nr:poly ADP-ribose polymerase family, member PARP family [Trichomonas vaginalis G3]EAX93942.1 UBA/TS-N domain containing protein [Trichomonas vaginalis G3]KAI5549065.1 poly ADP-ribose polymerase family, member PARP family [Trichomonas vaginalis G3]|eukprot:XP_001306872.1 UBA/TS-N domain containing protein [Trichomonas vaginalis G3]
MTEYEEVEYVEYEEEEEIIEDDSSDELIPIISESAYDPVKSAFEMGLNTYNAFRPYNEVSYSDITSVTTINLLTNVLPLSLQSILCLNNSPILLKIKIGLNNFDWHQRPRSFEVENPIFGKNFAGIALVRDLMEKFFSPNFKIKDCYRSKPFLLASQKRYDNSMVKEITNLGFTENQANAALEQVDGNLEYAINLLRTGILPQDISTTSSLSNPLLTYSSCPVLYLILEIVDIYLDLTDHCCICRKKLKEPTIKPTICEDETCRNLFEKIGIGSTVLQEIKRDPIVADLLFSVFATAIGPFLNPSPSKFSESQMKEIFKKIPDVYTLGRFDTDADLCRSIGVDAYNLIRWILLTNKSHFLALPEGLRIREINAQFQFLTLISSTEREEEFKKLKDQYGSFYLWHGSAADRWYSILRNGLKNLSKSNIMANGAAYGEGIYFARQIETSLRYMRGSSNGYTFSSLDRQFNMIALCEVIKDFSNLKEHDNFCHTLKNEKECIVRFLFINVRTNSYDSLSQDFKQIPTLSDVLNYYADEAKKNVEAAKKQKEVMEHEKEKSYDF